MGIEDQICPLLLTRMIELGRKLEFHDKCNVVANEISSFETVQRHIEALHKRILITDKVIIV